MLNLNNKILTKLISLILAQIFLLTGISYPESAANKNTYSIYIEAKHLRVPMIGSSDESRLEELSEALDRMKGETKLTEPVLDPNEAQYLKNIIEAVYPEQIQRIISRIKTQVRKYSVGEMRGKAIELLRSPSDDDFALKTRRSVYDVLSNSCFILQLGTIEMYMKRIEREDKETLALLEKAILIWEVIAQLSRLDPLDSPGKGAIYRWLTKTEPAKVWLGNPKYRGWLYDVQSKIRELRGDTTGVKAYYYAIGGGFSSQDSDAAENIDIVSPLIAADFDQLVGADVAQGDFKVFQIKIKKDLSSLQKIDPKLDLEGILFSQGAENIGDISYPVFTANFRYQGKSREVKVYYNLDATQVYPDELEEGYNVLYSRGNSGLIEKMSEAVKSGLVNNLVGGSGFIVMENLLDSDLSFDGFNKVSLGDVSSWAGPRSLDFYTNISGNVTNELPLGHNKVLREAI